MHNTNTLTIVLAFLSIGTAYSTSMSSGPADRSIIPSQTSLASFRLGIVKSKAIPVNKHLPVETIQAAPTPVASKKGHAKQRTLARLKPAKNQSSYLKKAVAILDSKPEKLVRKHKLENTTTGTALDSLSIRNRLKRIARQRKQYIAADKALLLGKRIEFGLLISKLKDYPLYPYLITKDYSKRLSKVSTHKLGRFLKKYGHTIPGVRLRFRWTRLLAKQHRWSQITKIYRATSSREQTCLYKTALYKLNKKKRALAGINKIWLTYRRLPSACNFIVKRWRAAGRLTKKLVWQRAELMFNKRRLREVLPLKAYLSTGDQAWLKTWYNTHRKPQKITSNKLLFTKHPMARRILAYGIKRLARNKPVKAAALWRKHTKSSRFTAWQNTQIKHQIGMTYAYRGKLKSLYWLSKVPEASANDKLKAWRVRVALAHKKWPSVLHWIGKLKSKDYSSIRWTYWRARALEATGKKAQAKKLYQRVAKDRSFEGFLAADRLHVPYSFQSRKLRFPKAQMLKTESHPGILRAREFFFTGHIRDARREWYYTIRKFKEQDLRRAALIAHRWHWHDRAILTLGKSRYRDDLSVRFPLRHKSMVIKKAAQAKIEAAWAMAVIRRESAFQVSARSGVGARGLMQLMPRTARYVARKLKIRMRTSHLKRPALNITLGISYLRYQLDKFSGNPVLATAAYNAGPHRVTKWLKQHGPRSADIWVETIPYHETREYCRNVMAYIAIYERRMGLKQKRLKTRLKPVSVNSIAKTDINF